MFNNRPRRRFLSQLGKALAAIAASKWAYRSALAQGPEETAVSNFAYVGSFTSENRGAGDGINVYRVDANTGEWIHVQLVADLVNPSFLAVDQNRRFLYSVHADLSYVSAFTIDAASGRLTLLNRQETGGTNPVHLAVDPSNRFLVVSNYASGSMSVLPINEDGSIARRSDLFDLPGSPGPHPTQQTSSHPHHNPFDPEGRFLLVADKGLDAVFVFQLDVASGELVAAATPSVQAQPGAGPRHAGFHPRLPFAYVLNELDSTVTVYDYDAQSGFLNDKQLLSSLPENFAGENTCAEISVHPSGLFLYASNRGHDSIVAYGINQTTGLLTHLGWTPTGGERPRYFGLDPSGTYLHACNALSHNIVTFRIDLATGSLTPTGRVVETGSPVTIVFA
jgi:6-phosphogluconolactonase